MRSGPPPSRAGQGSRAGRAAIVVVTLLAIGIPASGLPVGAAARDQPDVRFAQYDGYASPGTPDELNKVGTIEIGPKNAKNVLVFVPGTSASAAYYVPIARDLVEENPGWQVWAVERRENLLEDHSVLDEVKAGKATPEELFEYYLGFVTDPSITDHYEFLDDADVAYARDWGMRVAVEDLRRVVTAAKTRSGKVVMGGHSLGASILTAYATWDFDGRPGADDLSGLVFIDGGSGPTPISPAEATASLDDLEAGTPWLTFGGIAAPYAGLFNAVGSTTVHARPDEPSTLQDWVALPANLKAPVAATSLASYGFALDVATSPPALAAAHAHLGELDTTTEPAGWDRAGALTPVPRYANMFSGTGLPGHDGTAWYHPLRLTIDSGAVAAGNANPAQQILDLDATHGSDLSKKLLVYAFGASLGGQRVLDAAQNLADQSSIPASRLTLVDRIDTYAHNDFAGASPENDFVATLTPFLRAITK
ncbi:MAG: hypothetical protein R6X23_12960 [Acidimicrobiia bacterium]